MVNQRTKSRWPDFYPSGDRAIFSNFKTTVMDFSAPKVVIDQAEYNYLKGLEQELTQPTKNLVLTITNILSIVLDEELKRSANPSIMSGLLNRLTKNGITVAVEGFNTRMANIHPDQIRFQLDTTKLVGERTIYNSK